VLAILQHAAEAGRRNLRNQRGALGDMLVDAEHGADRRHEDAAAADAKQAGRKACDESGADALQDGKRVCGRRPCGHQGRLERDGENEPKAVALERNPIGSDRHCVRAPRNDGPEFDHALTKRTCRGSA